MACEEYDLMMVDEVSAADDVDDGLQVIVDVADVREC